MAGNTMRPRRDDNRTRKNSSVRLIGIALAVFMIFVGIAYLANPGKPAATTGLDTPVTGAISSGSANTGYGAPPAGATTGASGTSTAR